MVISLETSFGRIMNKKKIIISCSILVLIVFWFIINPPGVFGYCRFGYTNYNSFPYPISDIQIRSDGEIRKVDKTHRLKIEDIQWLLDDKPQVLIIAIGWDDVTEVNKEIMELKDIEIKLINSSKIGETLDGYKKKNMKIAIHYHSTC